MVRRSVIAGRSWFALVGTGIPREALYVIRDRSPYAFPLRSSRSLAPVSIGVRGFCLPHRILLPQVNGLRIPLALLYERQTPQRVRRERHQYRVVFFASRPVLHFRNARVNPDALRSGFIFGRDSGSRGRALGTSRASTTDAGIVARKSR